MRSIVLHVDAQAPDCPGCLPGEHESPCRVGALERTGPLQASGQTEEVQHALSVLEAALAPLTTSMSSALSVVQALHLGPDEAEVMLTVPAHCAGARLNEAAFHALRLALPDRDIYVRHAAAQGQAENQGCAASASA